MLFIDKSKLKNYNVKSFLSTENFKKNIKPKIIELFKKLPSEKENNFKKLFYYKKIFDDFSKIHNKYSNVKELNKYSSYIGKWSEIFFDLSSKLYKKDKNLFDNSDTWIIPQKYNSCRRSPSEINNHIAKTISKTCQHFSHKEHFYKNESYSINTSDTKRKKTSMENLLEKDRDYFFDLIIHFKKMAPYFQDLSSGKKFGSQNCKITLETTENICEISNWEIDFYDIKNKCIIDLKFQQNSKWNNEWIWQLLIYVYLLKFDYGIEAEEIKILNTFAGEEWSAKLKDIFPDQKYQQFFQICKTEILDKEKRILKNRIIQCFLVEEKNKNIEISEIIAQNFYIKNDQDKLRKYLIFFNHLKKFKKDTNFFSWIQNDKWIWEKWLELN